MSFLGARASRPATRRPLDTSHFLASADTYPTFVPHPVSCIRVPPYATESARMRLPRRVSHGPPRPLLARFIVVPLARFGLDRQPFDGADGLLQALGVIARVEVPV